MTSEPTVHELALTDILIDDDLQVRRKLDASAVTKYASIYKSGGTMPPIRVARIKDGGALKLVDGWHRVSALQSLGIRRTQAEVFETTDQGARWEAARANLAHGVPLKSAEYRTVFKAYIRARQHYDAKGRLKSYRDIATEIGRTRSYSTIRNWMLKDFPRIARKMGGADDAGAGQGGLVAAPHLHPEDELLETGLRGAANAAAAARAMRDPGRRARLIEELTRALKMAQEAGPWDPAEEDF